MRNEVAYDGMHQIPISKYQLYTSFLNEKFFLLYYKHIDDGIMPFFPNYDKYVAWLKKFTVL